MQKTDSYTIPLSAKGAVTCSWLGADGQSNPIFTKRNQLTYGCADVIANLLSGRTEYVPAYVGFIYGDQASPTLTAHTLRTQSWANLTTELASVTYANMQISSLSVTPTISVDGSSDIYTGNSLTFYASTRSGSAGTYGFPVSGGAYAGVLADSNYLYHAVLLTKLITNGTTTYIPVARVSLQAEGGGYLAKPAGFELALHWQVSFF